MNVNKSNNKSKINAALIGYGMGGRVFHAPIISSIPGFNLAKIYTTKQESAEKAKSLYPDCEIVNDTKDIFSDDSIELVAIATTNQTHFPLAFEALNAGKHVVVDKPFTVTSHEADQLIETAEKNNRIISVFHNRRWDADFRTVKKVIESGMLGNIVECEIHFDRFRNYFKNSWKEADLPGSGLLYDIGSHLIDQAQCIFGEPSYITADLRKQRPGSRAVDNFELILDYGSTKVVLKAGMLVKEPLPHFIVLGDKGSFVKYGMDIQEADLNAGLTPMTKLNWGEEPKENYGTINMIVNGLNVRGQVESLPGDYREYYRNIYEAIALGAELEVTSQQARNTIKIIELAEKSSNMRCTVEYRK